jgi:hypothetical protein
MHASCLLYAEVLALQSHESMSNTTVEIVAQGWVNSPSGRGTIDIIYSCLTTIFLCIWSVLCVNISPLEENPVLQILYKCKIALLCIIGPDFLLYLAMGQWESACRSCQEFRNGGYAEWTMRHAFFRYELAMEYLGHLMQSSFIT